jgi:hypothetical protein
VLLLITSGTTRTHLLRRGSFDTERGSESLTKRLHEVGRLVEERGRKARSARELRESLIMTYSNLYSS